MSLRIDSLLNPDESINQEAEVRKILSKAYADCDRTLPRQHTKQGTLAYLGDVLVHITQVLYKNLTDEILDEDRLNSMVQNMVDQAYRDNGFNDRGILEFHTTKRKMLRTMKEAVDANVTSLKYIRDCHSSLQEQRASEPGQHIFSESSSRSSVSYSASSSGAAFSTIASQASVSEDLHIYHRSDRYRRSTTPSSPQYDDDGREDMDDDETLMGHNDLDGASMGANVDLDSLRHRGKGQYICPHWQTCQKGGQDNKGGPKIFYRNCMYRQHLQKHSKPHKCMLPGCPNKDGFARKDQLVRHQANVKHDQPSPLPGPSR